MTSSNGSPKRPYGMNFCSYTLSMIFLLAASAYPQHQSAPLSKSISFVVAGDPQPEEPPDIEPEVFNAIVREVGTLQPDCVLIVGDMIRGFTDDSLLLAKEWNGFANAVQSISQPILLTAGNHDIWDDRSQQEFVRRTGSLYRSTDIGPAHFILLNSSVVGENNRIGTKQLEWLKADLQLHRNAPYIFVSVHVPIWTYGKQSNWMDEVHPLLKKYGVRAVFAGHWHIYQRSDVIDGVRYYVTGGAGGMMAGSDAQSGDFHHYILVKANEHGISYAVVEPGSIHDDGFVTKQSSQFVNRMRDECFGEPRLEFVDGIAKEKEVVVSVANPFPETLIVKAAWKLDEPLFIVEPSAVEMILKPGESTKLKFTFKGSNPSTLAQFQTAKPTLAIRVTSPSAREPIVFYLELVCMRSFQAFVPVKEPSIDGVLNEWDFARALKLNDRSQVTLVPERWNGPEESSGRFIVGMNDSSLFLAGEIKDSDVIHASRREEPYQGDAVTLYLDLRDSAEFQKRFFYKDVYALVFTPVADNGADGYVTTVYPYGSTLQGIRFASKKTEGGYTIEAAIPRNQFKGSLAHRKSAGFDIVIDNLKKSGERVRMAWNGTWGDFMNAGKYGLLKLQESK